MKTIFQQVADLLTPTQRRHAWMLVGLMFAIGILQMGAVTSIMPFMAVVSEPELVEQNEYLAWFYEMTGFEWHGFVMLLGFIVLAALVVTNVTSAIGVWLSSRFVWSVNSTLSRRLLVSYLSRPYLWFVENGSSEAGKNVLIEVERFTIYFLQPLVELLIRGTTVVFLIALLVIVDWKAAVVSGMLFGGTYGVVYLVMRRNLAQIGVKRGNANEERYKVVQEAFGAFKETKAFQRERFFVDQYDLPTRQFSSYMVRAILIKGLPRYLLELLAFGGMVGLVLYLLFTRESFSNAIPVLSLYAFAGYRLMPALQHCFASLTILRFHESLVGDLHRDIYSEIETEFPEKRLLQSGGSGFANRISLAEEIRFEGVTFSYPGGDRPALADLSFSIPSKGMIAFCGSTGSGKSTIADLILGLFFPQDARISADGKVLTPESISGWRQSIGYVPQHIFLSDSSIAANIAFGIGREEIDSAALVRAAKAAQIHEFIEEELPQGYETVVGERGVRLSGGQRQRLGIARALYHDPDVLIF